MTLLDEQSVSDSVNDDVVEPTFRVRIHYREPTYELFRGPRERPFRWTYDVVAATAAQARELALREFEDIAKKSSVGWHRQVVLVEMDGLPAGAA